MNLKVQSPSRNAGRRAALALAHLSLTVLVQGQTISFDADRLLFGASPGVGARALAMGGAFIAVADDASATFWNPAGLSMIEKKQASVVWQPHATIQTHFAPLSLATLSTTFSELSHASNAGWKVREGHTLSATSRSLDFASLTIPFRIGRSRWASQVSYSRVWDLGLRTDDSIQESGSSMMFQSFSGGQAWGYSTGGESREELSSRGSGGIDVVAGGLGVTVTRRLRLGIAVNRWTGRPQHWVRSERMESSASQRYRSAWTTTTEERFSGTNVSLGALFKPIEKLRVGFVFKASFDLARKSENTYRNTESFNEGASVSRGGGYESDGRVTYPHGIGAGIAFAPSGSLTVSADWTRRNWSKAGYAGRRSMGDVYLGDEAWDAHPWPTWTSRSSAGRDGVARQADARQLRVGAEYVVKRPRFAGLEGLPLRVGVFSDRQPFKTLELQAVDYLGLTAGLGLMWRRISVDWTYVNVRGNYKCCERDSESFNSGASFVWLAVYRAAEDGSDRFRSQRFYLSSTVRF